MHIVYRHYVSFGFGSRGMTHNLMDGYKCFFNYSVYRNQTIDEISNIIKKIKRVR